MRLEERFLQPVDICITKAYYYFVIKICIMNPLSIRVSVNNQSFLEQMVDLGKSKTEIVGVQSSMGFDPVWFWKQTGLGIGDRLRWFVRSRVN